MMRSTSFPLSLQKSRIAAPTRSAAPAQPAPAVPSRAIVAGVLAGSDAIATAAAIIAAGKKRRNEPDT